jgi:NADPH:quinone reductase-like Zn-dependent oxidoreductase
VIDYTAQDFTKIGETFDFVFDAVGKASYLHCRRLLGPGGRFAATDLGPHDQNVLVMLWSAISRSKRFVFPIPRSTKAFVQFLKARMEAGEFRAVIDRKYPLEAIADAYRYVATHQKTGIVVIDVVARAPGAGPTSPG